MKKVVMSVISDLATDQRVHKVAVYLQDKGADLLVVGRKFKDSPQLTARPYKVHRISCWFRKGVLQYAEFNFKLLIFLLRVKTNILISNDLDTLVPNYLKSRVSRLPLVYDAHEYFTGVPELMNRPIKRWVWKRVEHWILPKIMYSYTVNDSIRDLYKKEFSIEMKVVRNLPVLTSSPEIFYPGNLFRDKKILIMQGAGINNDRGYEEAIMSMKFLPDEFILQIIGNGVVLSSLKDLSRKEGLQQKVQFIDRLPYEKLMEYTRAAYLGLSLDKPVSINNMYSLPNKLFDYLKAGIPVLCSGLPEIKKIVEQFGVGICIDRVEPKFIAETILAVNANENLYSGWKNNTGKAIKELNWQKEIPVLDQIYSDLLK
jgi:glycosyltransferase involved in cell wall biosynthesis